MGIAPRISVDEKVRFGKPVIRAVPKMPRFPVDEDLPRSLARVLRENDIHAEDARDVGLRGRADDEIIRHAAADDRVLLTADLGFGNIPRFPLESHAGVVVARLSNELPTASLNHRILAVLRSLSGEEVSGNLTGHHRARQDPSSQTPLA
jgi:predicted nuclease of predicted toxin-antitoxin system